MEGTSGGLFVQSPPCSSRATRARCPGLCPGDFGVSLVTGAPQIHSEAVFPDAQREPPVIPVYSWPLACPWALSLQVLIDMDKVPLSLPCSRWLPWFPPLFLVGVMLQSHQHLHWTPQCVHVSGAEEPRAGCGTSG